MKVKLVFLIISCVFLFSNCKKGPEDPKISFRSRKARLEGEWFMKSGNASLTKAPLNQNFSFNGTKVELNETEIGGGPAIIYTGAYTLILNVKKNGTFDFKENFAGGVFEASGDWDFMKGNGDAKNKERVKFTITNIAKGVTDDHLFNQLRTSFNFNIVELRNKELKLESLDSPYTTPSGLKIGFSSRYTFSQR